MKAKSCCGMWGKKAIIWLHDTSGRIWDASRFERLFLRVSLGKFVVEREKPSRISMSVRKREKKKKANGNRRNDSREKSKVLSLDWISARFHYTSVSQQRDVLWPGFWFSRFRSIRKKYHQFLCCSLVAAAANAPAGVSVSASCRRITAPAASNYPSWLKTCSCWSIHLSL